ncbi:MAG: HNH endonuclease [Saprospiraceae bacterium]|nr:HNH endonuclease [Saprospiraceae bacterium]
MAKQRFLQVHFLDKKYLVHRLVANAFLGLDLKNKSMVACHKDDNTENNNVENLFV